ncbi:hypothetical protein HYR99_07820 [Candidatus Poribacteria bacterium]|nr:hypothetical protein [Candidatus Poribacteria bacterium]
MGRVDCCEPDEGDIRTPVNGASEGKRITVQDWSERGRIESGQPPMSVATPPARPHLNGYGDTFKSVKNSIEWVSGDWSLPPTTHRATIHLYRVNGLLQNRLNPKVPVKRSYG